MSAKTTLDILRGARELIATPERWTKETFARDSEGHEVVLDCGDDPLPGAACFCLEGAMIKVAGEWRLVEQARDALGFKSDKAMYDFNDDPGRTHAEVLARLDSAIQAEEAKVVK